MKKVSTTVKTGDVVMIKGRECRIGLYRKRNGKGLIDLHFKVSATSGLTEQVSTRELNQLLQNAAT